MKWSVSPTTTLKAGNFVLFFLLLLPLRPKMLCLKSEALREDQTLASSSSSSPSIDRTAANATFRIPINWYYSHKSTSYFFTVLHLTLSLSRFCWRGRGSSIRRYLKKTGTFSRRSYSSGDGSLYFPDLDVNVPLLLSILISLFVCGYAVNLGLLRV